MYQIDNSTAAAAQPASTAAGTAGYFTDGNPATSVPATIVPAEWLNSVMMELLNVLAAGGVAPVKNQFNQVISALNSMHSPVVGSTRNGKMTVAAASATATYTADSVIVATALNGQPYRLANFNKTINLATTGAGGMDTGAAPVNGFVALYAIYNPTTGASALLAQNVTGGVTEIYSGANMPAGYSASALLQVIRTNGSSQFIPCFVLDREVAFSAISVMNLTTTSGTYASLAIGAAVPPNAKAANVSGSIINNATGNTAELDIVSDGTNLLGALICDGNLPAANAGRTAQGWVPIVTQQTLFNRRISGGGTTTFGAAVTGYRI